MVNKKPEKDKVSLDHNSSVPIFIQIAETMKRRIVSGQYNPGRQLFTGEELEREFQTSNITIRKAMEKLKNDGYVERRRGLGTTVSRIEPATLEFELGRNFKKLKESIDSLNTQVKVLDITRVPCSEYVGNYLSLTPEQEMLALKRIRIYNGFPVSFNAYYADSARCSVISKKEAEKDDILNTLEKAMEVKIHCVRQTLRAVSADLDISGALEIPFGAPAFFNESVYYSAAEETLFLSQTYFRGDMFIFRTSSLL